MAETNYGEEKIATVDRAARNRDRRAIASALFNAERAGRAAAGRFSIIATGKRAVAATVYYRWRSFSPLRRKFLPVATGKCAASAGDEAIIMHDGIVG